jgi:hypothetical protein
VVGNRLVAGFDRGISIGDARQDLLLPSSWEYLALYGDGETIIPFDSVQAIAVFGEILYVGTHAGVQRQDGAGWATVFTGGPVRDLAVFDDAIWAATDQGLFLSTDGQAWVRAANMATAVGALAAVPGEMIVAAGAEGTFRLDGRDDLTPTKVPGVDIPPSDSFTHLAIDSAGTVWVAPGGTPFIQGEQGVNRLGVFALAHDRWRQFPSGADGMLWPPPGEPRSGYISIAVDRENRVWTGTWGTGISIIDQATNPPTIRTLTNDNSSLTGLAQAPNYTVVSALLPDPSGAMWAFVWHSLVFAAPRGYVPGQPGLYQASASFIADGLIGSDLAPSAAALDRFGVLWVGTRANGIILLDTGRTPTDGGDDQLAGTIGLEGATAGPGLPSWLVSAIAVDRDGAVWVGTDKGLAKFTGTYERATNVYQINVVRYTRDDDLPSDKIQALVVDSANVLWVGTDNGLAQVLPSGQIVNLSSVLLVDPAGSVAALAFDAWRGYLWVGTPRGLNRYEAYPPHGQSQQVSVQLSDNPFRIALSVRGEDYVLTGRPLTMVVSPGATVRIYTLTGELVFEQTDGGMGQITWDGRTLGKTKVVASGIYLYVAERAGQRKLGKIAVLRDAQ